MLEYITITVRMEMMFFHFINHISDSFFGKRSFPDFSETLFTNQIRPPPKQPCLIEFVLIKIGLSGRRYSFHNAGFLREMYDIGFVPALRICCIPPY